MAKPKAINPNVGWKLHFDPINEAPETIKAIEDSLTNFGVGFKNVINAGGERGGKFFTAYPQSLENRDKLIEHLQKINNILRPQSAIEGNFNITDRISGRFTTGYTQVSKSGEPFFFSTGARRPNEAFASLEAKRAGRINRFVKDSWGNIGEHTDDTKYYGFRVTGPEHLEDILELKSQYPDVYRLMVGKSGYVSPYESTYPDAVRGFFRAGSGRAIDDRGRVVYQSVDKPPTLKTSYLASIAKSSISTGKTVPSMSASAPIKNAQRVDPTVEDQVLAKRAQKRALRGQSGQRKAISKRVAIIPVVTQTVDEFAAAEGFIGPVAPTPLMNVGTIHSLGPTKAERRAEAFRNYMANRSPEQVAQAERNEARRMGPPERSTLKVGRRRPMRTNLDYERYYPEPAGAVWYPGARTHLSYDSILAKRAEDLQATINAEPVHYIRAAKQAPIIPTRAAGKATTATKEMLAKSTLDAIEVVQSRRLGYAAVAVGAGAIYLGNRRRSRKEEI